MKVLKSLENFLLKSDSWIFIVYLLVASHLEVQMHDEMLIEDYLDNILLLFAIFSPLLFLEFFKSKFSDLSKNKFTLHLSYFGIQAIYLAIINLLNTSLYNTSLFSLPEELLVLISAYWILIAIGLHVFKIYRGRFKWVKKIRYINLNKALILSLLLIAGLMALLIISDYDNFTRNRIVDAGIDYKIVMKRFPLFLGIWLQVFIAYMAGFFFYYLNANFLIPKLLRQRGILFYIFGGLGTIFIFYPLMGTILKYLPLHQTVPILLPSENYQVMDPINGAVVFGIMIVSIPLILTLDWFKQNNDIVQLEKQNIETELDLLKQQINPHFFFNTLNNLYAMSLAKSDQTSEVVMQLSELMRYVIYRGKEEKVTLEEEVKYIEDYISLQQIRLHQKLDLAIHKNITNKDLTLAPLLLIILVENAFKHGIEPAEGSAHLIIDIKADENTFFFQCCNTYEEETSKKGIGLENLKRRLEILYPEQHQLSLIKEDQQFIAQLKINFS